MSQTLMTERPAAAATSPATPRMPSRSRPLPVPTSVPDATRLAGVEIHRGGLLESLRLTLAMHLLRWLTRDAPPLFLRAGDTISLLPQAGGRHEPHVAALIERLADAGWDGFLIDIGANIGLTSCQSADRFAHAFLFEPNPDAFRVLEVNTAIALTRTRAHLHPFGLAAERRTERLCVPRDNWGGAFVPQGNAYDAATLAAKEGRDAVGGAGLLERTVRLEPAAEVLGGIFDAMRAEGRHAGVVKLDVEGFELEVLRAMAPAIPDDMALVIVFESWDASLGTQALCEAFGGRARLQVLQGDPPLRDWPAWRRALAMLTRGGRRSFALQAPTPGTLRGDLVLTVDARH